MGFLGFPMGFYGFPWDFMGFPMGFYEFQGILWVSNGIFEAIRWDLGLLLGLGL